MKTEQIHFENPVWKVPRIQPLPKSICGISQPVVDLNDREGNGVWRFLFEPVEKVPSPYAEQQDLDPDCMPKDGWKPVKVPCELAMQGFNIRNNTEYYYQRQITIPQDYQGSRIFLRFDGVYSNGRCWVDGHFVGSHTGGFTSWNCEITDFAQPGETVTLTVGAADLEGDEIGNYNPTGKLMGDPSWASYYAHHNIGGILRDVLLYAVPKTYLGRLRTNTVFDASFQNARLEVGLELEGEPDLASAVLELTDSDGTTVCEGTVSFAQGNALRCIFDVEDPRKWDAEHPYLYALTVRLFRENIETECLSQQVGFREITYGGARGTDRNKIYVNGREVKLRGTCRHDVSLTGGRSTTPQEDWDEILAYRNANINHVRTSHYPPSRHFLEACDVLGMYVEEENGACFQGANGYDVHSAPENFVAPFTEMVERDRSHPSVIIWSLGNESGFERTEGYRTEYNYIKKEDLSRPVIFSYPFTVETLPLPYDIFSRHYASVNGELGGPDTPVLHDEFAHIPCYEVDEQREDPNTHVFWGRSIQEGWEKIFDTDGALGADLWGGIDDEFILPEGVAEKWQSHAPGRVAGYGSWGCVLDIYRREKPEAYMTRKAYSPVVLEEKRALRAEGKLFVPVRNRFDHTSLAEVELRCSLDGERSDVVKLPAVAPHESGVLVLEEKAAQAETVRFEFWFAGRRVDEYELHRDAANKPVQPAAGPRPVWTEDADEIAVFCQNGAEYRFSKQEGGLVSGSVNGKVLLKGAFRIHANGVVFHDEWPGISRRPWKVDRAVRVMEEERCVLIVLRGQYGAAFPTQYVVRIYGDGQLNVEYNLRSAIDGKNASEFGLAFDLADDAKQVSWNCDTVYSAYPEGYLGRGSGRADRVFEPAKQAGYGARPQWRWEEEMYDEYLYAENDPRDGLATRDFRALRENIRDYQVHFADKGKVCVYANGDKAARVRFENGHPQLIVDQVWCYQGIGWGNDGKLQRTEELAPIPRGTLCLKLEP